MALRVPNEQVAFCFSDAGFVLGIYSNGDNSLLSDETVAHLAGVSAGAYRWRNHWSLLRRREAVRASPTIGVIACAACWRSMDSGRVVFA